MGQLDDLKKAGVFEGGFDEPQEDALAPEEERTTGKIEPVSNLNDLKQAGVFEGTETSKAQSNLSIVKGGGLTPNKTASAYNRSVKTGMNMNLAMEAEKLPDAQRVFPSTAAKESPSINRYMGKNITDAAISQGDEDNLLEVERSINNIYHPSGLNVDGSTPINFDDPKALPLLQKAEAPPEVRNMTVAQKAQRAFTVGRHNLTLGRMRFNQIFNDTPEQEEAITKFKGLIPQPVEGDGILEDIAVATASMSPLVIESFKEAQKEGVAAAAGAGLAVLAGGQLPPFTATPEELITVPIATAYGYSAGAMFGASKNIFEQEAGLMYDELLEVRDENGQPIDRTVLKAASLGYAGISTVLEMIGLEYITKTIPGGQKLLGRLTKAPIKKALKNPGFRKALLNVGKTWIKGSAAEGVTEGSQRAAALVAIELSKYYAKNKDGAYFLPFNWENAFREVGADAYQGTLGGLGFGSIGTTAKGASIVHNVNQSKKYNALMTATKELTDKTKTVALSKDNAERFVNETELSKEGSIDPDSTFYQLDEANEILLALGVDPRKAREKLALGQDVSVLNAKVLAQLSPEQFEILSAYIKPKPDSYTEKQVDAKEPQQEAEQLKETYADLIEDNLTFKSELDRIKKQIIDTGRGQEEAEASTVLVEQFANGLALQGQDRTAFLKQIEIRKKTILEKIKGVGKRLTQAPTATAETLGLQLADIEVRIQKVDTTIAGADELIQRLENQKASIQERLSDTALDNFDTLFQGQKKIPRAHIDFVTEHGKPKAIITLLNRANASSIPHELGHLFLHEMSIVEFTEGVTDQFKVDMQGVRNFLGIKEGVDTFTRTQQEKFARGFEQWLRDGKAPNEQMDTIFARFKRWLTEVYKSVRSLRVTLTPEIRGVFNRMLDADNETMTAAAINNMVAPTTERMNNLGIQNEEQFRLKRLVNKAIEKASNLLFRDRNNAVNSSKEQFTKDAEAEIRAEDRPGEVFGVYDVIDDIKLNGTQFSRQEYNQRVGNPKGHEFLPAKNLTSTKDTAISLDETALAYEFDNADAFVEAISNTLPLDIAIQNRVDQKNVQLENTFKVEDYLARVKEYSDYIARMGKHLREAQQRDTRAEVTGKPRKAITIEQMKAFAQDKMNELSVREAQRVDKFLAAMKRAAVQMAKAERAKDWAKAIRENEKMLVNKEMANIAVRNKKFVDSFVKRAKTFRELGKPKSVSLRFREGVRSLIERFGIVPNIAPQKPVTIDAFKGLLKGDDHIGEFFPSDFLLQEKPRDYRNLSMLELTELDNAMKYLKKQGFDEQTGILSDGVTKKETVVKGSVEEMDSIKPKQVHDRFAIRRKTSDVSRKFFARLLGLPYITKALGGYKALKGVISFLDTHITEKLKDIEDTRLRRYNEVITKIKPLTDKIVAAQRRIIKANKGRKLLDSGVPVPVTLQDNGAQLNYWTPEQVFSLAFNRGNQSNVDAVLAGYQGLTIGQIDTLLNKYLTQEDMDAVQGILDAMEELFAETDRVHVAMKGFHMQKVKAQEWTFKGKTYRGGYYPLNYDRVLSDWIAGSKETQDFFESEDAKFVIPYAASQHTTKRKNGHALPVDLQLIHVFSHFDKALRYITHAETIRDIDRITMDSEFKAAAEKALGKDVYQQIRPALKHIANPHIAGVDIPGKKMVNYLRQVATSANLALNVMVSMKQVFSTPSAIHDMGLGDGSGFKAYLNGMTSVLASPAVHFNTMIEMSAYMKERITSWERDLLRPKFNKMTPAQRELVFGNRSVTWSDVVNLGFFPIKAVDTATVMPIWWGSYYDKLNANSTNEAEAIRHADNIVRDTQPSATSLDLSSWFREGGFFSLFNLHQTFTVGKYGQRQRTYYRAWQDGKISAKDYAWFNFMDAVVPLISINVMVAFLRGGDLSEEEDWFDIAKKSALSWLFMGIPIVSSMVSAISEGWRKPLEIPGAKQVDNVAKTIGALGKGSDGFTQKEKTALYMGMFEIGSDFSRVPAAKLFKKANDGDTFKEKLFGKPFKKRKRVKGDKR